MKISNTMCEKHSLIQWSDDMRYHHSPLSEVCYNACLPCIKAHLHTVESIEDEESRIRYQAFALECVAWGRITDDRNIHEKVRNQEECLLFLAYRGWKDTSGFTFDHIGGRLSFSCAIKLCATGTVMEDSVFRRYIRKSSSRQIRLLTRYTQNTLGLLWCVGYKFAGKDIANLLVTFL